MDHRELVCVKVWTGFNWLRISSSGKIFNTAMKLPENFLTS